MSKRHAEPADERGRKQTLGERELEPLVKAPEYPSVHVAAALALTVAAARVVEARATRAGFLVAACTRSPVDEEGTADDPGVQIERVEADWGEQEYQED